MSINFWAVLAAAGANFIIGAVWYMAVFGNLWGQIHGFDKLSKKEQDAARKEMGPFLILQFVITVVTAWSLAKFHVLLGDYSMYSLALLAWIGFVVPTQIAAVVFGGTEQKWMFQKSAIMASGSLVNLLAAAFIIAQLS